MSIFAFVKDKISILEIIGQYTTLKRAGTYWKGACPFHSEKTGSFTVSPHRDMFYCFGCHAGGDIISFVAKAENCSPIEAVKFIADRHGIELPESLTHEIPQQQSLKDRYLETCKAAGQWMHKELEKDEQALQYLTKRGITSKTRTTYALGLMPGGLKGIRLLIEDMRKQAILVEDLIQAGLLVQGKNSIYSPYEDRIIFPIKDGMGRICGFGGRTYKPEDSRPKYYNSKEHDCFVKGSILYGLSEAKKSIQEHGYAFMVEGYMDCIAMAQHGYTNTVATMGTACTLNHLKLLARYANELYVVYDGDSAGQHAILKLTELCWQVALTLKIIRLPEGHDPDSFLSAGNDLKSSIAAAQDIFFFFIESTGKDFAQKTVHEKVALSKHLLTIIKTIEDTFTKDLLLQQTAKTLDIPFETLKHELRRTRPPVEQNGSVERTPETNPEDYPIGTLEKKIFCAILYKVTLLRENHHKMLIHHIPEPYKAILKRRLDEHAQHKLIDFSLFFAQLNAAEQRVVSKALFEEAVDTDDETFDQLVVYLHRKQWKTMVKEITREIQQAKNQGDEERVQGLLQDFLALKQKIVPHVQNNTEKGDI